MNHTKSWAIKRSQTTQKNYFNGCSKKPIFSKDKQNVVLQHAFSCAVISEIFALVNALILQSYLFVYLFIHSFMACLVTLIDAQGLLLNYSEITLGSAWGMPRTELGSAACNASTLPTMCSFSHFNPL